MVDLKAPFSTIDELASTDEYKVLMGYGGVHNDILEVLNSPRLSQPYIVYIISIDVLNGDSTYVYREEFIEELLWGRNTCRQNLSTNMEAEDFLQTY